VPNPPSATSPIANYLQTGSFAPARRGPAKPQRTRCSTAPPHPGRIYKLSLDGQVLGYLGKSGKQPKQFGWIHEIACPSENELYVAEILNWRVQKLILRPGPEQQKAEMR
jgi:hypothetical protein